MPAVPVGADDEAAVDAMLQSEGVNTPLVDPARALSIYGFVDVGFEKTFLRKDSVWLLSADTTASSFILGNINLFFDAKPRENWRSLVEIRLTNVPHGQIYTVEGMGDQYVRGDNRTFDNTSPSGRNRLLLGNIVIERAFIEYSHSDLLQVRAGLWFTPYGIWNVEHGTPTLISLLLPHSQFYEFFPRQQLGVQFLGSVHRGRWEYGYQAYVSNGRMTAAQHDLTEDKALGGRLFVANHAGARNTTLGLAGYHGTIHEDLRRLVDLQNFQFTNEAKVEGKEWGAATDLSINVGRLRIRSEAVMRRLVYETGKRQANPRGSSYEPDSWQWNVYGLAAYRFQLPWFGLEPYLWLEYAHQPLPFGDTMYVPSVGANIHFTPEATLRLQGASLLFDDMKVKAAVDTARANYHLLTARFVLAF